MIRIPGGFTVFTMSEQRENILVHACDLFLRDGFEGFSMRKLARAVGVTAPALYRYYDSKEELLHDILSEAYRRLRHHLYDSLEGATPSERFRMAGEGYLTFAIENPRLYNAIFVSPHLVGLAEIPDEIAAQGCAVGRFWNDRIRECMDAGLLRRQDPEQVGLTLWAHAHGMISLYTRQMLAPGEDLDAEVFRSMYKDSVQRLFEGLAATADDDSTAGAAA